MFKRLLSLLREDSGQGLTEYALIIALVAVAIIATVIVFRGQIITVFSNITTAVSGAH